MPQIKSKIIDDCKSIFLLSCFVGHPVPLAINKFSCQVSPRKLFLHADVNKNIFLTLHKKHFFSGPKYGTSVLWLARRASASYQHMYPRLMSGPCRQQGRISHHFYDLVVIIESFSLGSLRSQAHSKLKWDEKQTYADLE